MHLQSDRITDEINIRLKREKGKSEKPATTENMIFFHKATRMNTSWWHSYLFSVSLQKHAESLELDMALITLTNPAPSTLRLRNNASLHFDCGRIEIIARFTDPISRLLRNHRSASRYLVMIKNEQVSGCRLTGGTQAFFFSVCLCVDLWWRERKFWNKNDC